MFEDPHPVLTVMALTALLLLGIALLTGFVPITAAKEILDAAFSGVFQK